MTGSNRASQPPDRSLGGQRWTAEEDDRLLELVVSGQEWRTIAAALNRTFSGVQNRFRFLKGSQERAAPIVPRNLTRAQDRGLEPDWSCGAFSVAGRRIAEALGEGVRRQAAKHQWRDLSRLSDEVFSVMGGSRAGGHALPAKCG